MPDALKRLLSDEVRRSRRSLNDVAVGILAAVVVLRPPTASLLQAEDPEPARAEREGEPQPIAQAA